jgi:hypothetical protein
MAVNNRYDTRTSFIDMLMSGIMNLFVLFILALVLISPSKKDEGGIKPKAEIMISAEWPTGIDCDIDLWVALPNGKTVWWKNKSTGLANLERDDTGILNDSDTSSDGSEIVNALNQENMVVRGIVPGEYVVNLHLYRHDQCVELAESGKLITTVKLYDINPTMRVVDGAEVVLSKSFQEEHVFRFHVSASGDIDRVWVEPKNIVDIPNNSGMSIQ